MSDRATITIRSQSDRERICKWARGVSIGTHVEFKKAKRSTDQNAKMWAMLAEISAQVEWYGVHLSADDWKDVFSASLRKACVVPGLDAGTFVPLGMRTSNMTVSEMSDLLELMSAFAAERGVVLRDQEAA